MWCSICGVSGDKVRLFDMVGPKEIVKVCEHCARNEQMPIISKATANQIKAAEHRPTLDERLAKMRGEKPVEKFSKANMSLKQTVNRNYERKFRTIEKTPRPDLIRNFQWTILRVRRERRITQEQMARDLGEPESAIRLAERGILPADNRLVRKIEDYLGIKLVLSNHQMNPVSQKPKTISIEPDSVKNLKIEDMQKKKAEFSWEEEDLDLNEEEK